MIAKSVEDSTLETLDQINEVFEELVNLQCEFVTLTTTFNLEPDDIETLKECTQELKDIKDKLDGVKKMIFNIPVNQFERFMKEKSNE